MSADVMVDPARRSAMNSSPTRPLASSPTRAMTSSPTRAGAVSPTRALAGSPTRMSAKLTHVGSAAMTQSLSEQPSPNKPGSMEETIKVWLKIGNIEKLQQAVLDGYGWFLQDQTSRLSNVNKFLRKVPTFQEKIDMIHDLTIRGELGRLKVMLDRKIWVTARDHFGHTLIHKAIMANQEATLKYLVEDFSNAIDFKDNIFQQTRFITTTTTTARRSTSTSTNNNNNADATTTSEEDEAGAAAAKAAARRKEKMKRKKRRQRKEEEDQGNSTSNEQTDTLPRLRPGAATASSRRQPPPESPVKMRSARKQSSVTAYDLKEYLAKSKIVGDRYNISNVIETANRLKNGDTAVDQKSNDSGYSDTAPRMKPSPFGNKFRDIVMKAAADKRAASEITVKQRAGSQFQRYEEVFQAVNLSNEEFEAKIKGMKHLPPVQNKGDLHKKEKKKIPPTPRIEMNIKLALPPIVMSQQAAALGKRRSSITNQFSAGYDKDADYEFYKDIKFTYVLLPVPDQEFPLPPPNRAYLRTLIHNSDLEHLEKVVLDGHGQKLLGESSAIDKVGKFLQGLPDLMDTISILHYATMSGIVPVVTELMTSERLALSRDGYGATPLHKAVLFYQPKLVKLISEKYNLTPKAKDQEGRTPLHYSAALNDSGIFYRYLLKCGADELIQDKYGKTSKHYVYSPHDIDLNSLVRRSYEMPRRSQIEKKMFQMPGLQAQNSTPAPAQPENTKA